MGEGSGAAACIEDKLRRRRWSIRRTRGLWNSPRNGTVCNALIGLQRDFGGKCRSQRSILTAGIEPRRTTCEASFCGDLAHPHVEAECLYAVSAEWPHYAEAPSPWSSAQRRSPLPVQGPCEGAWLRDRAPFFVVAMSPVVLARWRVN